MRVTREQAAENRARIVRTAGRLFRERGFDGIGVADLMKAAGLTHGGFYGHFASKDALAAESLAEALKGSKARWQKRAAENPDAPLAALVDYYLSDQHRDARALSCPVAALASETSRQSDAVRKSFGDGVEGLVEVLSEAMPETDPEDRRQSALVAFSAMVGSVMLSRAVGDQTLADEFLQASRIAFARQGEE
ncbi:MAG TPA: TetR/AcrR family transcriptional regulator [Mesorhizobium sp.]